MITVTRKDIQNIYKKKNYLNLTEDPTRAIVDGQSKN